MLGPAPNQPAAAPGCRPVTTGKGTGRMSPTTPAADGTMTRMALRRAPRGPDLDAGPAALDDLLHRVARGDAAAFEQLYDRVAGSVFGVIRRVLRDPAQSEEVAQEVLVEVWRTATRFDRPSAAAPRPGSTRWPTGGRSTGSGRRRRPTTARSGSPAATTCPPTTRSPSTVETRLEQEQVRRCLRASPTCSASRSPWPTTAATPTSEVAELLDVPLGTVKTRMRDGLIRLRDCLGVMA